MLINFSGWILSIAAALFWIGGGITLADARAKDSMEDAKYGLWAVGLAALLHAIALILVGHDV